VCGLLELVALNSASRIKMDSPGPDFISEIGFRMFKRNAAITSVQLFFMVLFLMLSLSLKASEDCVNDVVGVDVCEKARALSDEISLHLPMRMNRNMTMGSVVSFGSQVRIGVVLAYDRQALESLYREKGLKVSQAKEALDRAAFEVCREGRATRAFIDLGGTIKYGYSFIDGDFFSEVEVSSC